MRSVKWSLLTILRSYQFFFCSVDSCNSKMQQITQKVNSHCVSVCVQMCCEVKMAVCTCDHMIHGFVPVRK